MSAALDMLVVAAAKVPTESLGALAIGSDAPHAPVWAFEVTGDVISAGEPGGRMLVRKITDNGRLLSAKYAGDEVVKVSNGRERMARNLRASRTRRATNEMHGSPRTAAR